MRILYLDLDAVRPDHLGCYGYSRNTSPNIDSLARKGTVFSQLYCSDSPCMPSRTAMFTGRFGARTGAVCHAGTPADPFIEGPRRDFTSELGRTCWMTALRDAGHLTATISSFGERHSAWWWYAGFNEIINPGGHGMESAEEITPVALDWLERHADDDNWFLHVNYWDAHTPYRAPESFGHPFKNDPPPTWPDKATLRTHWDGVGAQSARERSGFDGDYYDARYPRQPDRIADAADLRRLVDGYDTAIRYIDTHIGRLLAKLQAQGVLEDTAIIISADHGETLGEFNIYACHQIPDAVTTRVPGIVRWPGLAPSRQDGLRYQFDLAATLLELAGGTVPSNWDGDSTASMLRSGKSDTGRPELILSHAQGSCARAVRWDRWHYLRFYHDAYRDLPEELLFDIESDPHETTDLGGARPVEIAEARRQLSRWENGVIDPIRGDPMQTALREGGPPHLRNQLTDYLKYLHATGRSDIAERIAQRHAKDLTHSASS
jgi:choline-sulfatase